MNYLNKEIVVVGLGYVGLPLAVGLSSKFSIIGFDSSKNRVEELLKYIDVTAEISRKELRDAKNLKVTSDIREIKNKYIYIVTVPTPVTKINLPNLSYLKNACKLIGQNIAKSAIIIFESTVFPGVTEEICAPIISKKSGYVLNKTFFLGYSPERINPGDKYHKLENITKVVSGSNPKITNIIGKIYSAVIKESIFYAKSIKVAETAKAIENAQRDINIAFINEVALICQKLDMSVYDVLEAAKTKWNFLSFKPGLVGGHCIGVDPYYLAHIAKKVGYDTKLILAGRNLNDEMVVHLFKIIKKDITLGKRILQIGITFKENVTDIRNSKAAALAKIFVNKGYNIDIYDPVARHEEVNKLYDLNLVKPNGYYDYIVFAVPHKYLLNNFGKVFLKFCKNTSVVFDIKGVLKNKSITKNIVYKSL